MVAHDPEHIRNINAFLMHAVHVMTVAPEQQFCKRYLQQRQCRMCTFKAAARFAASQASAYAPI